MPRPSAIIEIENPHISRANQLEEYARLIEIKISPEELARRAEKDLPRYPGPKWEKNGKEFDAFASVGKHEVNAYLLDRLGAFAACKTRKPHQELAAAWFKSSYENKYGRDMTAVDPSVTPVQSSGRYEKAAQEFIRIARGFAIDEAITFLGKESADLLIAHLVNCISVREMSGAGGSKHVKFYKRIFEALDRLAHHLGYAA